MDWFLYDIALRHERLKKTFKNAKFYRMSKKTSEIKVTKSKAYVYAKNIQTFNVSIHNYLSICQCLLNHLQFDLRMPSTYYFPGTNIEKKVYY